MRWIVTPSHDYGVLCMDKSWYFIQAFMFNCVPGNLFNQCRNKTGKIRLLYTCAIITGKTKRVETKWTTFSNAFYWMKTFDFWIKFYWNMFLSVWWTISAEKATNYCLNSCWHSLLMHVPWQHTQFRCHYHGNTQFRCHYHGNTHNSDVITMATHTIQMSLPWQHTIQISLPW